MGNGIRAGLGVEVEAGPVSYRHTERLTVTTTTYDRHDDAGGSEQDPDAVATTTEETFVDDELRERWFWTARVAPFLQGYIGRDWAVGGGVSVQNLPVFYGYDRARWSCLTYGDGTRTCSPVPARAEDFDVAAVGSLFLVVSWRWRQLTVLGEFDANVLAPPEVIGTAPVTATIRLRANLPGGSRAGP